MKKYTILSPDGKPTRGTIPELEAITGFRGSNLRSLVAGCFDTFLGWCSMHPKAQSQRKRFMTTLIHASGQREVIGQAVTGFARRHGLCANEVYQLILGRNKLCYRGWMLEATYRLAH
jgi:hypothetical protein